MIGVFILGVSDEVHQMFVPGRRPGWEDLAADLAGIALATMVIQWVCHWKQAVTDINTN